MRSRSAMPSSDEPASRPRREQQSWRVVGWAWRLFLDHRARIRGARERGAAFVKSKRRPVPRRSRLLDMMTRSLRLTALCVFLGGCFSTIAPYPRDWARLRADCFVIAGTYRNRGERMPPEYGREVRLTDLVTTKRADLGGDTITFSMFEPDGVVVKASGGGE